MKYYLVVKNWNKINVHLTNPAVQDILVSDFNKYTTGRWNKEFTKGMLPAQWESCDWDIGRRGRRPKYHDYVKHGACHWLVNFNLILAQLVVPDREWRILTSQKHSTVWDGKATLFDLNFLALGIDPQEAFVLASKKQLPVGRKLKVYLAT